MKYINEVKKKTSISLNFRPLIMSVVYLDSAILYHTQIKYALLFAFRDCDFTHTHAYI